MPFIDSPELARALGGELVDLNVLLLQSVDRIVVFQRAKHAPLGAAAQVANKATSQKSDNESACLHGVLLKATAMPARSAADLPLNYFFTGRGSG